MPTRAPARTAATRNDAGAERVAAEQRRRHQPPTSADQQLDAHEVRDQLALEVARQPGADAHREQVGADDGGELQDRVAQQVAGERAGDELVDQPAGRDDEDRGQQRDVGGRGPRCRKEVASPLMEW